MRAPRYSPAAGDPPPSGDRHVVVYDGGCGMCQKWVGRLRRWDRKGLLEFVPFQDPAVAGRFPWIPAAAYRDALQVVAPNGETWEGAGAAEKLAALLPGGRPMAAVFRIPGVRPVADRVYGWVAENRDTSCTVHVGGIKNT